MNSMNSSGKKMFFEVSWEVCNMVGGIHTVLITKMPQMQEYFGDDYILIGPDYGAGRSLEGIFEDEIWNSEMHTTLKGLSFGFRMGRWLVPGKPKCILVRYDSFFQEKDKIFGEYWQSFGLNSLFGGHDYIEPAMFAHAAGMVIENIFYSHLFPAEISTSVQAHEWLSATTILYLKQRAPEIGTIFTTHATILGRTLANDRVNWENLETRHALNAENLAQEHHVMAKHSMEATAARVADVFTVISDLLIRESELLLGRKPDFVTLNGIGDEVPHPSLLRKEKKEFGKKRICEISQRVTGFQYDPEKVTVLWSSGRYEFENKGVDLILEALSSLNQKLMSSGKLLPDQKVIAFLSFPTAHKGPLLTGQRNFSTHQISDEAKDPISQKIAALNIKNWPDSAVHIVFVPTYLNGKDNLIPEHYYELLTGADLAIFPSFYEPWGYTAMESVALNVPTLSTDKTGFALWASLMGDWQKTGIHLIRRRGVRFDVSREEMVNRVMDYIGMSEDDRQSLRNATSIIVEKAKWSHLIETYLQAYHSSSRKVQERLHSTGYDRFRVFSQGQRSRPIFGVKSAVHTRSFRVLNHIPQMFQEMKKMVTENVWWYWQDEVAEIFEKIDADLWKECEEDPYRFLESVDAMLLEAVAKDPHLTANIKGVLSRYKREMAAAQKPQIAYFCMEYGFSHLVKIYSGGLGILAGDHLKSASDLKIPLCALGLAYRDGYFYQDITQDGRQEALSSRNDFLIPPYLPVMDGKGERIRFSIMGPGGSDLWLQAWKVQVGRVPLYLLDTDVAENEPKDRVITDRLYGGGSEHRIQQEYLLAVGGHELLRRLGEEPKVYHMNEGHTAFLVLSRVHRYMKEKGLEFDEALQLVRHSTIFTTHTPVPAGHDVFSPEVAAPYVKIFDELVGPGRAQSLGGNFDMGKDSQFSMTALAAKGSLYMNGVSQIHGDVSRRMFHSMVPQLHPDEVPVGAITNGVHASTWVSPEWQHLFDEYLGRQWRVEQSNFELWDKVRQIGDVAIWETHSAAKRKLIDWLHNHVRETWKKRKENPAHLAAALANLSENTLIATFARRFAPYKRGTLLFRDPQRLAKLLSGPVPMVLLFAGKAHPMDKMGQELITRILEYSRRPEFAGKIILVENYEIHVSKLLVSGSDVWINTPLRPLEASGTSGMKAGMNGCLNLSVPDGWWAEAVNGRNGWAIGYESLTESPDHQDSFDSVHLYTLFENEILPKFHRRNTSTVPEEWVQMMKESIHTVLPVFNTHRMLEQYNQMYYEPAIRQYVNMEREGFGEMKFLASSRARLQKNWQTIDFADIHVDGLQGSDVQLGTQIRIEVKMSHPHIFPGDLQVQAVLAHEKREQELHAFPMKCVSDNTPLRTGNNSDFGDVEESTKNMESKWEVNFPLYFVGQQTLGVRVTPKPCHDNHPFDLTLNYVKWL